MAVKNGVSENEDNDDDWDSSEELDDSDIEELDSIDHLKSEHKDFLATNASLNPNPMVFYRIGDYIGGRKMKLEESAGLYQVYYCPWKNNHDEIVGLSVGFTSKWDVTVAARMIFENIKHSGRTFSCSYRYWINEKNWSPLTDEAKSLGVFTNSILVAQSVKWFYRLRLLAIGTLRKHEAIEHLGSFLPYLENVLLNFVNIFPSPTTRWTLFSASAFRKYVKGETDIFPGVDDDLILRFKCIERYGIDPDKALGALDELQPLKKIKMDSNTRKATCLFKQKTVDRPRHVAGSKWLLDNFEEAPNYKVMLAEEMYEEYIKHVSSLVPAPTTVHYTNFGRLVTSNFKNVARCRELKTRRLLFGGICKKKDSYLNEKKQRAIDVPTALKVAKRKVESDV